MLEVKEVKDLISVVTPVFNGEYFLRNAYLCLRAQTMTDWEWVVVNDGSTDKTADIMRELAASDKRIKYFEQKNSGAAKLPRDRAVVESSGNLILPLDADDKISPDYLETILARMHETGAEIVYPKMVFVDLITDMVITTLPAPHVDTSRVYNGRELVRETVPEWSIGSNGGLYRRQNWINLSYPDRKEPIWMYSDEVDERIYLLNAKKVAFASAVYTYLNHPQSVTRSISPKLFHPLQTNMELLSLVEQAFGRDSEEYARTQQRLFHSWRSLTALYVSNYRQLAGAEDLIVRNLRKTFKTVNPSKLSIGERLKFLNLCSFQLLTALLALKYSPRFLAEKTKRKIAPKAYLWNTVRKRSENKMRLELLPAYMLPNSSDGYTTCTVCVHNGNLKGGGLVDRLRGIVSTYMTCRQMGDRPFKILFTFPFQLSDYLAPNTYNWMPADNEITFDKKLVHITVCDTPFDSPKVRERQRKLMESEVEASAGKQQHVYTNALYCYDGGFAAAFHELFKPSDRLERDLQAIANDIGGDYVTVSARFCNLLDDFNEEVYNEPLYKVEQDKLICHCIKQITDIHHQYPNHRVVVCSDSPKMQQAAKAAADFVYCIEGVVSHIGNDEPQTDYEYYEKTFLDFFIISRAQAVFLLQGPGMLRSGFPYAAALVGGRQCEVKEFSIT